jgi:hypothetical protein
LRLVGDALKLDAVDDVGGQVPAAARIAQREPLIERRGVSHAQARRPRPDRLGPRRRRRLRQPRTAGPRRCVPHRQLLKPRPGLCRPQMQLMSLSRSRTERRSCRGCAGRKQFGRRKEPGRSVPIGRDNVRYCG